MGFLIQSGKLKPFEPELTGTELLKKTFLRSGDATNIGNTQGLKSQQLDFPRGSELFATAISSCPLPLLKEVLNFARKCQPRKGEFEGSLTVSELLASLLHR